MLGAALLMVAACSTPEEKGPLQAMGPAEDAYPWNGCMVKSTKEQIQAMKATPGAQISAETIVTTAELVCKSLYDPYVAELRKQTAGTQYNFDSVSDARMKRKHHEVWVKTVSDEIGSEI
jgi:hypothetical protein